MPTPFDRISIEMTGSPKEFGFKTKEKFLETLAPFGVEHHPLTHGCKYLVTNDLSSDTIKMKKAKKYGAKVITYGDLLNQFTVALRSKKIEDLKKKMMEKQKQTQTV